MSLTHSEIIKQRAQELANLGDSTDDTVEFISTTILRTSAQRMESELGSEDYGNYVTMFADNTYGSTTEYHSMTASQRKLYNLECAETYFCLYYLAFALKEMVKGDVFYDRFETGTEGRSISPSAIDKIAQMRDMYLEQALYIIDNYADATFLFEAL